MQDFWVYAWYTNNVVSAYCLYNFSTQQYSYVESPTARNGSI